MAVLMRTYKVSDLIGEFATTVQAGQQVYDLIHPELLAGRFVELDFAQVRLTAPPFLNTAIGDLLADIKPDDFDRLFKAINLGPLGAEGLDLVLEHSREIYANDHLRQLWDEIITGQSETE